MDLRNKKILVTVPRSAPRHDPIWQLNHMHGSCRDFTRQRIEQTIGRHEKDLNIRCSTNLDTRHRHVEFTSERLRRG